MVPAKKVPDPGKPPPYEPGVGQIMQMHVARQNDGSIHISTIAAKLPMDRRKKTERFELSLKQGIGVEEFVYQTVKKMLGAA